MLRPASLSRFASRFPETHAHHASRSSLVVSGEASIIGNSPEEQRFCIKCGAARCQYVKLRGRCRVPFPVFSPLVNLRPSARREDLELPRARSFLVSTPAPFTCVGVSRSG